MPGNPTEATQQLVPQAQVRFGRGSCSRVLPTPGSQFQNSRRVYPAESLNGGSISAMRLADIGVIDARPLILLRVEALNPIHSQFRFL